MKNAICNYWNQCAASYDKRIKYAFGSQREKQAWQKIFTEILGDNKLSILDLGTGPGIIAFYLAELGHDLVGIDLSPEMIKSAKENAIKFNLPVEFKINDAENLPFPDESFDAIVSRHLLWTIPDPEKAVLDWKRVLKPNGKLLIIDGDWSHHNGNSIGRKIWRYCSYPLIFITEKRLPPSPALNPYSGVKLWSTHKKRPDADKILLANANFKDISIRYAINRQTRPMLEHIKYGHSGDAFLISGIKGSSKTLL